MQLCMFRKGNEVIYDPALGKTRDQRAFGGDERAKSFMGTRKIEPGMYGGPRASYGRYQVSEQASDILNKQIRSYNR